MDFNKIELTSAQQLLLNLVRILVPLVEGSSAPKRDMGFLKNHIFVPPFRRETPQNYEVQLLTTLQVTQKEMKKWAEPTQSASRKGGEKTSFPQIPDDSPVSVVAQAKNLVVQVRLAIQTLSSSSNLDKPEAKVFRDAIGRLKPLVDELVEAVGRTEMSFSDRRKPSLLPFRPLPKSPREHLLNRAGPLPSLPTKEKPFPQKTVRSSEKQETPSFLKKSAPSTETKNVPFAKSKGEGRGETIEAKFLASPAEQRLPPSPSERMTPTGAPYLPEKPLLSKQKKKKKRRKELWPEKEED